MATAYVTAIGGVLLSLVARPQAAAAEHGGSACRASGRSLQGAGGWNARGAGRVGCGLVAGRVAVSGSDVSANLDRVSAAAGGVAAAVSERFGAVADRISGKLSGAGANAGRTMDKVADAAKDAGEAASEKVRDARESVASAVAPEPATQDGGVNARVRDAAREAGEAARSMETPTADAGSVAKVAAVRPAAALEAPRENRGDDLKKIKGVGPKLEAMLAGSRFLAFRSDRRLDRRGTGLGRRAP